MTELPQSYDHHQSEARWSAHWENLGIHRWDPRRARSETFIVDTPPPTVSGSLHMGHVFSYTHTDVIVRYQRMTGKNILYPMGWDDNGLPTERRVQNKFAILCNPNLSYREDWAPTEPAGEKPEYHEVSRRNFIEACSVVTRSDEAAFEELWRRLALSVDWSQQYATIDDHCRRISQRSFLDLVAKGLVYNVESPTMWDITFRTALAQADLEDRPMKGAFHEIRFGVEGGGEFVIATTRPELLVSCIAVVAHPDDSRYQPLFGRRAVTPLFGALVPILPSPHADPEKGSGIMMVCTFGDAADVEWWKTSGLPIKQVIGLDGRLQPVDFRSDPFRSTAPERAEQAYAALQGKTSVRARGAVAELLAQPGSAADGRATALVSEPKAIEHPVKFYEKGDAPIEFITTRQWFVRILEHRAALLAQGERIAWHPDHMRLRYTHWVQGLNQDWCISRQRFFGVPFPVWYPIDQRGVVQYDRPLMASESQLPVDPFTDVPDGYREEQRNAPGGFTGDRDVMDTWATSSLTPQISSFWGLDGARHRSAFPADIRPQSHEIIRTWAFYTIVKAWMHEGTIPWSNVIISGWILDPDRKKMSKSKGNVVTPQALLDQHSSDAVRYWAARARLGVDTAFDEKVFLSGRKLTTKIFNASKFVLSMVGDHELANHVITEELDRSFVAELREVIGSCTEAFQNFEYAGALQATETAFWSFCDHYVELVKARAYDESAPDGRRSAVATLQWSLRTFLRLFAPFLPYITEEVWSWRFAAAESKPSVHVASWPDVAEVADVPPPAETGAFAMAAQVLGEIHHCKSKAQRSLKWPVAKLSVTGSAKQLSQIRSVAGDVSRAGRIRDGGLVLELGTEERARPMLSVELGDENE